MSIELARGYVSLIPSMDGAKAALAKQLTPAATSAGTAAGSAGGAAMGGAMRGSMMKFMAPAAIAAGVVVAFKGLYEIGDTWNEITNTIRVGTGAQGEALDGLVQSVKNVGNKIPAELTDIGTVVADLNTRLGLTGDTLEKVASQYLEGSRILGEDLDIRTTTASFSAFGIEGEAVSGALDRLFQISQATGVGVNELATKTKDAAPLVKALGFDFDETASLVGGFDKAGLDASKMLGPLGAGLARMAKDGEQPRDVFPRVLEELEKLIAAGDEGAAIDLASGVFGTRGAAQFVNAVASGALELDNLVGGLGATEDTILGLGAETMTMAEHWQVLKNNASSALEPLGSAVFQSLLSTFQNLMPHLQSFASWLGDNLWVLGVLAGFIGVTLVAAFASWAVSIWASTIALLANPITWIVLLVVGLIAAIVLLVKNWDVVTEAMGKAWEWLKDIWSTAVEAVKEWTKGLWESISGAFKTGVETAKRWMQNVWDFIKKVWQWTPVGLIVSNWDKIVGAFRDGIDKVKGWLQNVWDFIKKVWSYTPIGMITSNWGKIMDFFREVPGKIGKFFSKVKDLITRPFKAAFNAVASLWNNSVGKLSFSAPDWVPGIGGKGFSLPKIPMLAKGGIVDRATLAMVGEGRHPEIVQPVPDYLDMVDEAASLRAGSGISIQVAEMNVRDESDIRKVAQELKRLLDRDARAVAY